MFKTLRNAWRQPELKNKLLFTILILILYRLGASIPVPYFNSAAMGSELFQGNILEFLNMLSGSALAQGTLFALGVSPYITASIVMQLLTVAIPKLGEKAKDGEEGKKFINFWTRIVTIALAIVTAYGYIVLLQGNDDAYSINCFTVEKLNWLHYIVLIACYCAGAAIVMWLAEKINESGIGNGISIILFANIIAGLPSQAQQLWSTTLYGSETGGFSVGGLITSVCIIIGLAGLLLLIVWMSDAERRIPVQYAKRVVGRKMYGGQSTNLPLKVNMAGVMPIIFANSIVALPATVQALFFSKVKWFKSFIDGWFNYNTVPYLVVFLVLLVAFAYFYIAISFDPVEVANNIKNNGGAILGIRPGKPTVDYIRKVLNRITFLGALLVAIIAGLPMIAQIILHWCNIETISAIAFGGSSMMIVVGVAIETIRELEAQLSLRNYKGFLD